MDSRNNLTLSSCEEIQTICKDFFNLTGISYFNFVRVYDDGSRICLSNNQAWMSFILDSHEQYRFAFEETTDHLKSKYLVWDLIDEIKNDELITIARTEFNIDHGFTLITRYDHFTEFCYFATTPENKHLNMFYINDTDLLGSFALYFKDKANHIIEKAEKEKLIFNDHSLFWLDKSPDGSIVFKDFFKKCDIKRFFLNGELKGIHLTTREAECVTLLFDGKGAKEIAKRLNISYRTVECYLESAKSKMQCTHRAELIDIAKRNGFMAIYDAVKAKHHRNILGNDGEIH